MISNCKIRANNGMSGAALSETLVLILAMLPVFFAIPMIGKLADIRQTGEQAARYAVWQTTVNDEVIDVDMQARLFQDPAAKILSSPQDAGANPLWGGGRAGTVDTQTGVTISLDSTVPLAVEKNYTHQPVVGKPAELIADSGKILAGLKGNEWGLESNGFVRTGVHLEVKRNNWLAVHTCGSAGNIGCLEIPSVILTDNWSAEGDGQAKKRIRSLVPASALEPLGDLASNVGRLPAFEELKSLENAFGHVDMEVLPESARGR